MIYPREAITTYVHPDLKKRLARAGRQNNRSLSAEVAYRLGKSWFVDIEEAVAEVDRANKRAQQGGKP